MEKIWKKHSWPVPATIPAFAWGTKEKKRKPSGHRVSRPRFEPSTSRIQVYNVTSRPIRLVITCQIQSKKKQQQNFQISNWLLISDFTNPEPVITIVPSE
jgi:hypothetical protein